jgi:predicted Fe-Mo cluster-binding NifX family protein
MKIAIPVDENKEITKMLSAKEWAVIDFDEGVIKDIKYIPTWEEYSNYGIDWIDFVVLENRFENILDFLNEGIVVLVRRAGQDNIEDIIEAFKFKELDEVGF